MALMKLELDLGTKAKPLFFKNPACPRLVLQGHRSPDLKHSGSPNSQ